MYRAVYTSPCPGGFHSSSGFSSQVAGLNPSCNIFGNLCWRKISGKSGGSILDRAKRVSSCVLKLFIRASFTLQCSACCNIISRKVLPSLTSIRDLGPVRPMLVPRPPFNVILTACLKASFPAAAQLPRLFASLNSSLLTGSISLSNTRPVSPSTTFL